MSGNDEMILMFTSNGEALYAQDAINLLAYPENTLIRFRYRERWIGNELAQDIRKQGVAKVMVSRKVLIVFVDRTIHPDVPILVPIRYATIRSAETEGSFHNLELTVGRYFSWRSFVARVRSSNRGADCDYPSWITSFRQMLEADFRDLKQAGAVLCGPPDKYLTRVVVPDHGQARPYFYEGASAEEGRDFEDIVGALHALPYFENTIFFRIRAVEEFFSRREYLHIFPFPFVSKSRFETKVPTQICALELAGGKFGYKLRRVAPYRLRLAIVNGKELTTAMKKTTVEISSNEQQITSEEKSVRIGAKNDFVSLLLFPIFQAADVVSRVSIKAKRDETEANPKSVDDAQRLLWQKTWLTAGDATWIRARNDAKGTTGKPQFYPKNAMLAGPCVDLEMESSHSSFYLRVGGLMLLFGYILNFTVTDDWLKFVRRASPAVMDGIYQWGWVTLGSGMFFTKMLGVYLLYCAFVVATRKLPTLK